MKGWLFWINLVFVVGLVLALIAVGATSWGWLDARYLNAVTDFAVQHWVLSMCAWIGIEGFACYLDDARSKRES